jgi:hypothetical protein
VKVESSLETAVQRVKNSDVNMSMEAEDYGED